MHSATGNDAENHCNYNGPVTVPGNAVGNTVENFENVGNAVVVGNTVEIFENLDNEHTAGNTEENVENGHTAEHTAGNTEENLENGHTAETTFTLIR